MSIFSALNKTGAVVFMSILLFCSSCANSQNAKIEGNGDQTVYEYNWESLKKIPVAQWFDDAKFGIFIHWGAYSKTGYKRGNRGYAEWSPRHMYRQKEHYYSYIEEKFGACPPEFGYKDIVKQFKAQNWDPDAWADLFKQAGARYVILTGEHHDGYALWDSDLTPWCATKVGPKRDLVGDLCKAVRAKGLKFAPSYHRERHFGFFAKSINSVNAVPFEDVAEEVKRDSKAEMLYGPFGLTDEFIADYVARWKELEEKYQPDFMWLDDVPIFYRASDDPQTKKFKDACMRMIADYMNVANSWGKEVYLNNKGGNLNWPEGIGCKEKDNLKLDKIGPKWENPATLGTSYGYMEYEEKNDAYKSPDELISLLCDVVSKNGNLLLNVGPRDDGVIPAGMQRRLLAMGQWLEVNGEAIYGTRPWEKFEQKKGNFRFTRKGNCFYAIALDRPAEEFVIQMDGKPAKNVKSVELLGSKEKIGFSMVEDGISVTSPENLPGKYAWTYKITME